MTIAITFIVFGVAEIAADMLTMTGLTFPKHPIPISIFIDIAGMTTAALLQDKEDKSHNGQKRKFEASFSFHVSFSLMFVGQFMNCLMLWLIFITQK